MISIRKVENNIYEIIIPDEGVHYERDKINLVSADMYSIGLCAYWSNFTSYYQGTIDKIYEFLKNNKNKIKYEIIEVYQAEKDINLLSVFKIKCDDKTLKILLKKIKSLINDRKNNYK